MDQHLYSHGQTPPGMMMPSPGMYANMPIPEQPADLMSSPNYFDAFGVPHDDSLDSKRRRIARACDMCRKKKIKCDGKMPSCTHCINYKTECVFTQVEKKRTPPKGPKYIEGLENRLARMEACLRVAGLLTEDDEGNTDLEALEKKLTEQYGPLPVPSTPSSSHATPREKSSRHGSTTFSEEPEEDGFGDMSDLMDSLVTNTDGTSRFLGSSSGFSIFSSKGMKWINEKTGDNSFQAMVQNNSAAQAVKGTHNTLPEIFARSFTRQEFWPLPSKEEAMGLVQIFFGGFNRMFPLFHQETFMAQLEKHYSNEPNESSSWWAAFNVVLALSHRLRVMSRLTSADDDQKAWGYLMNACSVFLDLTLQNMELLSVQAILGMTMFLQGTSNPQPCFFLVAAAIRVAQSIGLHKKGSGFNLPPAEREQRKRVFWIAYIVDQDVCLRSGRPPALDNDDMNIELPDDDPPDGVGDVPLAGGVGKCNLFRVMAEFAHVESHVYKELYSNKATRKSVGELLLTIGQLDQELEEWKDSIPPDFRPEHEIKTDHPQLILSIVMLHFAYLNCVMAVHRLSIPQGYYSSKLAEYAIQGRNSQPLNPRVFSSAAICVSAARTIIELLKYVPQHDCSSVWMALYFPVAALVQLFSNILQNPHDLKARQDMSLIDNVISFLGNLAEEGGSGEDYGNLRRTLSVCIELRRIANAVLEKYDKEASARRKRKTNNLQGDPKLTEPPRHSSQSPDSHRKHSNVVTDPVTGLSVSEDIISSIHATSPPTSFQGDAASWPAGQPIPDLLFLQQQPNVPQMDMSMAQDPGAFFQNAPIPNAPPLFNLQGIQQPYVPTDLFQMPMTLDWDWADMTSQMPSFQGMDMNQPYSQQSQYRR